MGSRAGLRAPAAHPVPRWRRPGGLLALWGLTRGLLVLLEVAATVGIGQNLDGDSRLYQLWIGQFSHGIFPLHDPRWQYPPGAVPVLVLPHLLSADYRGGLRAVMLAADLTVELALLARLRRGDAPAAAQFWTVALPLIGPLVFLRFDLVPAALVVLAVLAASAPGRVGALLAAGALVKVWPLALLGLAVRTGRGAVRALVAAGAVAALLAGGLAARGFLLVSVRSFLSHQSGRGLQVESLAALPVMIAAAVRGHPPVTVYRDGAYQLVGFAGLGHLCADLAVVVILLTTSLGTWAACRGASPGAVLDLCLGGVLLTVLVAEVLSPQYLIWLVAMATGCLVHSGRQRWAAAAVALACPLTAALFPYLYGAFLLARPLPVVVIALRDLALLAAAGLALRQAPWRSLALRSGRGGPSSPVEGSH